MKASSLYSPADFAARAYARLAQVESKDALDLSIDAPLGDHTINPGLSLPEEVRSRNRAAAVLIPVVAHEGEAKMLLTTRTEHLPSHAGQVAFPGGKIEEEDGSAHAAALREAEEEIGLPRHHVELLGYLPPYQTMTGFRIVPVVAEVRPGFALKLDPSEVANVFEVPLSFLMSADNHKRESRQWRGQLRQYYVMPYKDHYIWGVTAGIIRRLYLQLYAANQGKADEH